MILRAMALLVAVALPAIAAPPPGTDLSSPRHAWWECHHQPKNDISCCSEADGHALIDADWRTGGKGYQVRVEGQWFDVPTNAVLTGDTCGMDPDDAGQSEAKVWYTWSRGTNNEISVLNVLCFLPGVEY